ncbi:hypothetical protein NG895_22045 [Aeoliella sp. ICT_H6.2]|uniref:Uncharacterized protein n=1 Tax=Aeoliella straminimaris TaxID=2954799 RepID=A0A9X2JKI0_9BACT|nr:hypothetical protein [Aeoliella straminimaris]MCO6046589.1 hypothetical protein [Aeoliella straminimaris]
MHAASQAVGGNLLNQPVEYTWDKQSHGTWRRYMYTDGSMFAEYTSATQLGRLPLVHITWGKCPETGRRIHAVGVVAIGRRATGAIAIGQMAVGLIAIGQLALGVGLGLGQASTGLLAVGQAVMAGMFGLGQFVYGGYAAIAQFGMAPYVLAQFGLGQHVMDMRAVDPVAREFFLSWIGQ